VRSEIARVPPAAPQRPLALRSRVRLLWASATVVALIVLSAAAAIPNPAPDPNTLPSGSTSPSAEASGPPEAPRVGIPCDFCKTPQPDEVFFCTHCGRLFKLRRLEAKGRFWGDAFYVLTYPPAENSASLAADFGASGLVRESTSLYSGERYTLDPLAKKGVVVAGEAMGWGTSKAVAFRAIVRDAFDPESHLILREVLGIVKAQPARHLYRKIEYQYDGRLLSRIGIGTWLYRGEDDWEKRPSEWVRHDRAQVSIVYSGGIPTRIETTRRDGRKGLRGNLEYVDLPSVMDEVQVEGGAVTGIRRTSP